MNKEAHICFLYPFMTLNILCVVLKNTKVQIPKNKNWQRRCITNRFNLLYMCINKYIDKSAMMITIHLYDYLLTWISYLITLNKLLVGCLCGVVPKHENEQTVKKTKIKPFVDHIHQSHLTRLKPPPLLPPFNFLKHMFKLNTILATYIIKNKLVLSVYINYCKTFTFSLFWNLLY